MPANRQGSTPKTRRERRRVIRLEPVPAGRMKVGFVLLCAGLVGLVGRMAWLQIFQASELEARARVVQTQRTKPLGSRRPIVDRNLLRALELKVKLAGKEKCELNYEEMLSSLVLAA